MIFNNIIGLYALLALIPFILIYLIRPKSFERSIPSLMFIMQQKNKFRKASFLQKLLRNLLFFMQLLIIIIIALSVAAPFLEIPHSVIVRNNILVLDVSASMQTSSGIGTRFSKAQSHARESLGLRNTLILAEPTPVIVLEDARSGETLSLINSLTPKATSTNLGDAVLLAGDLLGDKKGVVTVISDFITTGGSDLLIAKRSLTAKGNTVNFINVNSVAENIGIVDLIVDKDETTAEIKNYKDEDETIKVTLSQGTTKIDKEITLLANSKEKIIFNTLEGVSKITLNVDDDMSIDNVAYISSPTKTTTRVLLITNFPNNNKIKTALTALKLDLEIREPPTVNAYNIDHDIVIISDITKDLFVPTDFTDLRKYVEKGGVLIIEAQEDTKDLGIDDLLPINIQSKEDKTTAICADIIGNIFSKDPFSEEPCFTSTSKYLKATLKNGTITNLASAKLDNSPVIIHMKKGLGEIIFYGIMDKYSSFYSSPFYPIFWNNIVNYLMKTENIRDYNFKGGRLIVINEQEVNTPSAVLTTNRLLLDEAGIYEFDNKKVAVNLLSERESDISRETIGLEEELEKFSTEKVKDVDDFDLEVPLLIAALIFLLIEFIYIKRRGDL